MRLHFTDLNILLRILKLQISLIGQTSREIFRKLPRDLYRMISSFVMFNWLALYRRYFRNSKRSGGVLSEAFESIRNLHHDFKLKKPF